jgi:esterase/lipase
MRLKWQQSVVVVLLSFVIATACGHQPQRNVAGERDLERASTAFRQLQDAEAPLLKDPIHASQMYTHGQKTKRAVLIMHGLHESPHYMRGLALAYFTQGFNVISLRLPGHQTIDRDGLNKVHYQQWVEAADRGYAIAKELGDEVELAGYSLGGTLAAYLALEHSSEVKKLVLISPALALSNRVFWSGQIFGWTGIDAKKICRNLDKQRYICQLLVLADDQIEAMLKEDLPTSPAAGHQVQRLIDFLISRYRSTDSDRVGEPLPDYYKRLEEMYLGLRMPFVMINTENDNVVNWNFNQKLATGLRNEKAVLLFKANQGVTHISINKSEDDRFRSNPRVFNSRFMEMLEAIQRVSPVRP